MLTIDLGNTHLEKNHLIPMIDGVELAADLYRPKGDGPFPTLISMFPYHKDDAGVSENYSHCQFFANNGYAHLLVDFRGLGNSGGRTWAGVGEGDKKDGAEVVEWTAHQSWCDGNIGMWGISYPGIMSLAVASTQPTHLKAIVPIFATSDLEHDFLFPGGCINCLGAFGDWGSDMVATNLLPPGYQDSEGRWFQIWKERLQDIPQFMVSWMEHDPNKNDKRVGVTAVENIIVPTFLIGGWRDIFVENVRIYERLNAPRKLMMGPWTHISMDSSPVEPWDYLPELLRWWDHWLKGEDTGIMDEPPVSIFIQGAANKWRNEADWPIPRGSNRVYFINRNNSLLESESDGKASEDYLANQTVGVMAGLWEPAERGLGLPLDQGPDDLLSLTYTTEPLKNDIEITGAPEAMLYVSLERGEELNLVAKLNDVAPDGSSSLITTGWLNANQSQPEPLKLSQVYEFIIPLWCTSYLIPAGHQLRLSISCSDFPRIWPTHENPKIRLHFGDKWQSSIRIPAIAQSEDLQPDPVIRRPDPSVNYYPLVVDGSVTWKIERDLVEDSVVVITGSEAVMEFPWGMKIDSWKSLVHTSMIADRPDSARIDAQTSIELKLHTAGDVEITTKTTIYRNRFLIVARILMNGVLFFERIWQ